MTEFMMETLVQKKVVFLDEAEKEIAKARSDGYLAGQHDQYIQTLQDLIPFEMKIRSEAKRKIFQKLNLLLVEQGKDRLARLVENTR